MWGWNVASTFHAVRSQAERTKAVMLSQLLAPRSILRKCPPPATPGDGPICTTHCSRWSEPPAPDGSAPGSASRQANGERRAPACCCLALRLLPKWWMLVCPASPQPNCTARFGSAALWCSPSLRAACRSSSLSPTPSSSLAQREDPAKPDELMRSHFRQQCEFEQNARAGSRRRRATYSCTCNCSFLRISAERVAFYVT